VGFTVGLPRMHKEAGERRDFLPAFTALLDRAGAERIVLEEGYGAGVAAGEADYLVASRRLRFGTLQECLEQDVVVVVRCPDEPALSRIRSGAILVSMLHYATRPRRVALLLERGIVGVSMDAIVDDAGLRLVENLEGVAWNGTREAFRKIRERHPRFDHPERRPLHVTCLGSGRVGGWAVHASTRYGDPRLREELAVKQVPGVEVTVVDFDLTRHEDYLRTRLSTTDLLIDATHREDPTRPVVPNRWLADLPDDAVILDLAADPYQFDLEPPYVKGIEGVPHGDLDRYVFETDDPAYDALEGLVETKNRRVALSCYSWPGLRPRLCMQRYGEQLEPVMEFIVSKPADTWDAAGGSYVERAVARAEVTRWAARA
jgi:alanine dehydrogenase